MNVPYQSLKGRIFRLSKRILEEKTYNGLVFNYKTEEYENPDRCQLYGSIISFFVFAIMFALFAVLLLPIWLPILGFSWLASFVIKKRTASIFQAIGIALILLLICALFAGIPILIFKEYGISKDGATTLLFSPVGLTISFIVAMVVWELIINKFVPQSLRLSLRQKKARICPPIEWT